VFNLDDAAGLLGDANGIVGETPGLIRSNERLECGPVHAVHAVHTLDAGKVASSPRYQCLRTHLPDKPWRRRIETSSEPSQKNNE
jgi:hypothetical protein